VSGRPHREFWVLALLLYGQYPWLLRRPGAWVRLDPQRAAYGTGIRVSRLRAALLRLRSAGLVLDFRPYQGCWDVQLAAPKADFDAKASNQPTIALDLAEDPQCQT
jgi:hypothetical protein